MSARGQRWVIAALFIFAMVFLFVLVPRAIEPYVLEPGLGFAPRLVPSVAAAGLLLALAAGWRATSRGGAPASAPADSEPNPGGLQRVLLMLVACGLFALASASFGGFYLGGIVLVGTLAYLMGERRPAWLVLYPVLLMAVIYGIFEWGFQMRLP